MISLRVAIAVVLLWTGFLPTLGAVPQTLNWTAPDHPVLPLGTLHPLLAEASSGLPVQFRVLSGPASIVGDQLLVTNVAEVSVIAEQAGDETYRSVSSVRTFNDFRVEVNPESDLTFGGSVRDVVTSGDRAFVLDGLGMVSILRVPTNGPLVSLGQYRIKARVQAMAASESTLFLYYGSLGRVEALDIRDPAHPRVAGWVQMFPVNHMELRDHVLFVALGDAGVAIWDVSDPARMQMVSKMGMAFGQGVNQVATSGDRLYLSVPAGIQILDISDLAHPRLVGGYSSWSLNRIVPLSDHRVGMATGGRFSVLDARDPQQVKELAHYDFRGGQRSIDKLESWGELVLLADTTGFLEVLNVGNSMAIRRVGRSANSLRTDIPTTALLAIAHNSSRVLVLGDRDVIEPVRIVRTIPQELRWIQPAREVLELDRPYELQAWASSGLPVEWSVVYGPATIGEEGLRLTGTGAVAVVARQAGTGDVAPVELHRAFNATQVRLKSTGTLPLGEEVMDLCVTNRLAFVALGRGGVKVIDLHRPEAPTLIDSFSATKDALSLAFSNQRLVIGGGNEIAVVDIRDPAQPQVLHHIVEPRLEVGDVGVWGSRLLVIGSRGAYRFNLENMGAPWNPLHPYIAGYIPQVKVRSSMALLSHSPGFDVWDISDPESAKRLAWLRSPEPFAITDVWMGDTLVWAVSSSQNADGNGFVGRFETYRLDDPIHPQLLGSGFSSRNWLPTSVTVAESLAFVGTVSGEHDIFDVRDPGLPRRVGKLPIGPLRLAAADGLVVTTRYSRVLEVYSLQEGFEQSLEWSVEDRPVLAPGIDHTLGVRSSSGMPVRYEVLSGPAEVRDGALTITNEALLQSVIVRATQSGGDGFFPVESVRVFNPLAVDFELLGELKLPGSASSISVSDGFAGVAGWAGSMCWVDVRNPSQPRLVTSLETGGGAHKVVVAGEFGYAADFGGKLAILDLRNPEAPVLGGSLDFGGQAWSVTVSGDLAYVAGQEGIGVVDVSDPLRPHRVGMLARPGNARVLDLQENQGFLYISESLGGITIADVRDPAQPKVAGSMEAFVSAKLVLEQNRLWLENGFDGFRWADISDPFHPRQELSIPIPLGNNSSYSVPMALKDGIIFCSSGRGRVEAFDIHNSSYVLASGSHSLFPEYANGIEVVGDIAYVAAGHRGLMVFRVHRGIRTAVGDLGVPLRGEPGEIVPLPGQNHDGVLMQYEVVSGPAHIEGGALFLDGLGLVVLKAFFAPSDRYLPAEALVSVSVAPVVLHTVAGIQGEAALLNWRLASDALESAASPAGPWKEIPEARPPFRPTVGSEPRFYRVVRR